MTTDNKPNEEQEKKSAILKHSNQLAEVPLQGFSAKEIDMFFGLCYYIQAHQTDAVTIQFNEVRKLLGINRRGNKKLLEELKEMSIKFSKISLTETTETGFESIVPFIGFKGDWKEGSFSVQAHPDFAAALNDLDGSSPDKYYTLSDVVAISMMKSSFSKHCLKMLFLYRNAGRWYVALENIKKYLDIPESYSANDIKRRVLDVIFKEFTESGLFERFEYRELKDESQKGAGRKKITGYVFRFEFAKESYLGKSLPNKEQESIICPLCGKPLIKIDRKDGTGSFFGHRGGFKKSAPCHYTASIAAEITPAYVAVTEEKRAVAESDDVSIGDLNRYYSYIRDCEIDAAGKRREIIRNEEPEIWELYRSVNEMQEEYVDMIVGFPVTEENRSKRNAIKSDLAGLRDSLKNALQERGYEADYMENRYRCSACKDTGQLENGMFCGCRKERAEEAKRWLKEKSN